MGKGRVDGFECGKGRAVSPFINRGFVFFFFSSFFSGGGEQGSQDACEKAMRLVVDPPSAARVRNLMYIKLTLQIHKQQQK